MGSFLVSVILAGIFLNNFASQRNFQKNYGRYDISAVEGVLLDEPIDLYDSELVYDEQGRLVYNEGYSLGQDAAGSNSAPKFSAYFDGSQGNNRVTTVDSVNDIQFAVEPSFKVGEPRKNRNRVIYPILGREAAKVYTLNASYVKEDVILFEEQGDELMFSYDLKLSDGTEARIEPDGSIGVYSVAPALAGNVSVGSDQDQVLLEKLRENSEKSTLVFRIPAPFVVEANKKASKVAKSWFYMPDRNTLEVHTVGLKDARYPLSIDPSIYVETARKLMRGNNESNIDFNVANELIQKGTTTGARIDSWDSTTQLNDGRWNGASAAAGGFIYYVGGAAEGGLVETTFSTSGSDTYVVPAGVTSVTIKSWGAGGGGGGGSPDRIGGEGGGGGFSASTITVTPAESLNVYVGGGGSGGTGYSTGTNSGNGGGGGGFSGVFRSTTPLLMAAGGGGGGGGNGDTGNTSRQPGDEGGAGGGTTGVAGTGNDTTTGGGGGTQSAGGAGGTASGVAGTVHTGVGGGQGGSSGAAQSNGGTNDGGNGGTQQNGGGPNKKPGGGGGGGGYYGGGGGGLADSQYNGGGGGGGGSGYTTGSPTTNAAGNGQNPGNSGDADRAGAGDGANGGAVGANGSAGDAGIVIISYSTGGAGAVQEEVYWSQIDDSDGTIDNAYNPGSGSSCVNWCTNSQYDLPVELQGHSLTAYNGYLYVMGGEDDAGTRQNAVYISKLGVNGEPQLWHPSDDNEANWVYWYEDTSAALAETNTYHASVAYNNKMYILGGLTGGGAGTTISTVRVADILPTGELGAWSTTGTTALTSNRQGHTVHIYNDYMYILGGNTGVTGTLQASVYYSKLTSDGAMSSWYNTNENFSSARTSWGGNFSTIWGGYLYIQGGCSAVDGTTGYCTTVENDMQLASINADGTITPWNTINGLTNLRAGHSLTSWRGYIYGLGGCTSQNPIDGQCADLILTNDYGTINQDGDASTVSDSVNISTGTCTGTDPYDCDTPPLGNSNGQGGQMAGGVVINNGHVYYIGGCREVGGSGQICTNGSATRTTDTIYYAEISNDGTLRRSPGCDTANGNIQYAGSWCVDNSNTINGSVGLAAFGYTVFNNTIYAVGGTDGAGWKTDVYRNPLNADGTLGTWTSQTQSSVGLGTTSIGYPFVFARANPASAGTNPGNLYVIGGCSNGANAGLDCGDGTGSSVFLSTVYKCNITTTGALASCTTTGQTTIDSEPATPGSDEGLGIMAGTVYANYVYLIGGQSDNEDERGSVMYAKIDDSNNIVDADGETATDDIWQTSGNSISPARRRGIAFGYNGYLYALAGFAVDTGLNDLLFAKIDVSDGSIEAFSESGVTVNQRWDLRGVISSGYVYTLGGCGSGAPPATCNAMTDTVQTFQLYNNFSGSTSDYTVETDLFTGTRLGASAAVLDGYVYIAGGCITSTACTATTAGVRRAPLNEDGSLGAWVVDNSLPNNRAWLQLEAAGGTLYAIGGHSNSGIPETTVYYSTPVAGDLAAWSTASNGLPAAREELSASVWNDRIYVTGGYDNTSDSSTVYYSPDLSSGGDIGSSWTSTTAFNVARRGHTTMTYANNIYVFGGYDGTNYLSDVQYAQIDADGSVGTWSYTTSLPQPIRNADGFAVNGYMYLFGGRSATATCTDNSYITPISANTTIATGNNPTGTGAWYQTREALDGGDRYGAAAVYNEGKAYVLGGGCGSLIGSERVLYATLFSQPQIARYSRLIDTDTDVFPTRWLLNGVDNDIGARWNLSYRSMHDISDAEANPNEDCGTSATMPLMTTWGQSTDFGEVTLGNLETYTPLNSTGGDINCARYYYFSINIDASSTYGYPDDVNRGPTIDDLTLFFTSDPNKRLRHGKTFTGGEQQPIDTPPD